ncbi:MAG: ABC transporter permease [Lentisphaerae bacterium]|nr:ABC transporter permease [Lentisphaerota bacterium]
MGNFEKLSGQDNLKNIFVNAASWIALVLLLVVCVIVRPEFRNPQTLLMIAKQVTIVGIIALGMTFVIAGGGIDLSVGSLFAFSGVSALLVLKDLQEAGMALAWSEGGVFLIVTVVALLVGALGGALNGLLVAVCKIPPFIATLGTLSIFRSLALHFAESGTLPLRNVINGTATPGISELAAPMIGKYEVTAVVFVVLTAICWVLMKYTAFGRHVCAVGANEKVAKFAGINTGTVKLLTYTLTGLLVGAGVVLFLGQLESVPNNAGNLYELDAIAAVVIGGTAMSGGKANVWGTLAGALILGLIFAFLNFTGTAPALKGLVQGVIILLSVLIQGFAFMLNRKRA